MSVVLDASAVLAYFHNEPGQQRVSAALDDAVINKHGELGRGPAEDHRCGGAMPSDSVTDSSPSASAWSRCSSTTPA